MATGTYIASDMGPAGDERYHIDTPLELLQNGVDFRKPTADNVFESPRNGELAALAMPDDGLFSHYYESEPSTLQESNGTSERATSHSSGRDENRSDNGQAARLGGSDVQQSSLTGRSQVPSGPGPSFMAREESRSIRNDSTHQPSKRSRKNNIKEFRARTALPTKISLEDFATECTLAAEASRLKPFALHAGEHQLLREHITPAQVTNYLNIRNSILRLWHRNPLVSITKSEAAGCAREQRYVAMALLSHEWLVRNGYINFGCVEVPKLCGPIPRMVTKRKRRQCVAVIGAGVSGLGCARQLEALFSQLGDRWSKHEQQAPRVVVLEGRSRVGGRVYSHMVGQSGSGLPSHLRNTADMGAQVVTGFQQGNPMDTIIRGQLGVPCHVLKDTTVLYDHDGSRVNKENDDRCEKLYNDLMERVAVFRNESQTETIVEGNWELMARGKDSSVESGDLISVLESRGEPVAVPRRKRVKTSHEGAPTVSEKRAGRAYQTTGSSLEPAAGSAVKMGWTLKSGVTAERSIDLEPGAKASEHPTLGRTMDDAITQLQGLLDITPLDMRLLNWHHANMEYANAANLDRLSLSLWDQDTGNEFEGSHCTVVGGYQQVPRGLYLSPTKLDLRFEKKVATIKQNETVMITCEDGEEFEADRVVLTSSLGVLKDKSINFEPALPSWKQDAIDRLGFGLLNKIVLVYDKPFWDPEQDMIGLLNRSPDDRMDPSAYPEGRGRFYFFWNCIQTSGLPMLVAMMVGDAAHAVETASNDSLIAEATARLSQIFASKHVPAPSEAVVTRWRSDPFARGSYSYVGPEALPHDYDTMAKPFGQIHFAGEATCGAYPATVHGAYLSGLRAAADVVESFIGPIEVPTPLVHTRRHIQEQTPVQRVVTPLVNPEIDLANIKSSSSRRVSTLPAEPQIDVEARLGPRPLKPARTSANPFLFFTRDMLKPVKAECVAAGKASRSDVRVALGKAWRSASEEEKLPFVLEAERMKAAAVEADRLFKAALAKWEADALALKRGEALRPEGENEVPVQVEGSNPDPVAVESSRVEQVKAEGGALPALEAQSVPQTLPTSPVDAGAELSAAKTPSKTTTTQDVAAANTVAHSPEGSVKRPGQKRSSPRNRAEKTPEESPRKKARRSA